VPSHPLKSSRPPSTPKTIPQSLPSIFLHLYLYLYPESERAREQERDTPESGRPTKSPSDLVCAVKRGKVSNDIIPTSRGRQTRTIGSNSSLTRRPAPSAATTYPMVVGVVLADTSCSPKRSTRIFPGVCGESCKDRDHLNRNRSLVDGKFKAAPIGWCISRVMQGLGFRV